MAGDAWARVASATLGGSSLIRESMLHQENQFGEPAVFARCQLFTAALADEQCQDPKLIVTQMNKNVSLNGMRPQRHFNRLSKSQKEERTKIGKAFSTGSYFSQGWMESCLYFWKQGIKNFGKGEGFTEYCLCWVQWAVGHGEFCSHSSVRWWIHSRWLL